ncbi:MAG: HEAT repeat domain-containing protein, partial [Methanofollis sp.]|nr:HEAT repeat domain-containing protein [Methanofollis sp.]
IFHRAWPRSDKALHEIAEGPENLLSLWDHQVRARDRWLDAGGRGVLEMATATGKTLVGLALAYWLFKKYGSLQVLVLCHSRAILNQWRRETIDKLGFVGDPIDDYTHPVSYKGKFVISFNTIQKVMRDPGQYPTDLLIVDEVHHGAGLKFRSAFTVPCRWKMGLSATVEGRERNNVLDRYLGKTVFTYTLADARRDGIVPEFTLTVHKTFLDISEEEEFVSITESIRKTLNFINATQTEKICALSDRRFDRFESLGDFVRLMTDLRYHSKDIPEEWLQLIGLINKRRWVIHRSSPKIEEALALAQNLGRTKKCVLFTMDIATCETIYERLSGSVPAFLIHSKLKDVEVRHALQKFRSVQNGVLIAPKMLDEGIDIPDAEVGINVASSKTKLQLIQRMGRILRNRPNKRPVFHHFVAVPRHYIVSEDSFTYQNDLAWITDVALKMGIPIAETSDESENFSTFERESEAAVRDYYTGHDRLVTDDFGVIKIRTIVDALLPEARHRLVRRLGKMAGPLTDEEWARVLRSAYGDEQMLEIPSQRWLLIIADRDPAMIRDLIVRYGGISKEARTNLPGIRDQGTPSYPHSSHIHTNHSGVGFWIATLKKSQSRAERDRAVNFLVRRGLVAVDPLICLLHDPNPDVRTPAIEALGQIGSSKAIEPLLSCLQDRVPRVRRRAVRTLGILGDPRARSKLMKLQHDPDQKVRKETVKALKMLDSD